MTTCGHVTNYGHLATNVNSEASSLRGGMPNHNSLIALLTNVNGELDGHLTHCHS